ncbi:hypothetical protein [Dactylosporangium sp. NPDC048998]|uniref:hypothetical protein n=1 Tax=Dactylosporangium sp. NPDC048998 TaxID=3363976 RepID=UPI00371D8458
MRLALHPGTTAHAYADAGLQTYDHVMFGIAGYEPEATDSANEVLSVHGPRLHALVGRRLESATGLCFVIGGAWCSTQPLILDFGGTRLELAFDGFDQMYLSWDTIDVDAPIDTPDQDEPDQALAWGDPHQAELDGVLGAVARQVRVLEHDFRFERADGQHFQAWILAGLELLFDDGRALQLYNVISELTIATHPADSDTWRRQAVRG